MIIKKTLFHMLPITCFSFAFFSESNLSENKVYQYNYELQHLTGLPEKGLARAGINMKCIVKIQSVGQNLFLLRVRK